ncbi:CaiB/BaiF CoA transferase family protein [Pseudonocardia sp. RS010]|uniref:CaiB/BaiF CoA transferase family protein n=1 Tax=Pseudonocardia sp. RS010 TaxID=3385979 RepID=UPI0039A1A8CB
MDATSGGGFLEGLRVVEIADELGEYCGKLLAGLGADVVKIEPPGGERTRRIGPFRHDEPNPNRSLHFWHYNHGKRSVVLDLHTPDARHAFAQLLDTADVLLDTRDRREAAAIGLDGEQLRSTRPALVHAHITPFGDDGPWADFRGSDLVHLALGGVVMNCGYDPEPTGDYDTPPVAPQMWQAYHITGEITAIQVMAALQHRLRTGRGQVVSVSVHDAVSKNTETDLPDWIFSRLPHARLTCRHSFGRRSGARDAGVGTPGISRTKDGRWMLPYRTYLAGFGTPLSSIVEVLRRYGMEADLADERYSDPAVLSDVETIRHIDAVVDRFVASFRYDKDLWRDGQRAGMAWAPVRRPEENVDDPHWVARRTFAEVEHPELGERYTYVGSKWVCAEVPWRVGPRPPLLGEHTDEVLQELDRGIGAAVDRVRPLPGADAARRSRHGTPFALSGVRVVDLTWFLASAGAGRFLAAHGAEVIKVEHASRLDGMRFGLGPVPDGGRAERDRATEPLTPTPTDSVNRSGSFMEINAGKRGISLNLRTERGRALLRELIRTADMVVEGFSPGTMDRMGFGYDRLKEINPRIVYVQQSGMGQFGTYGQMRSFGPSAQAMSGLSDMSGLPEPYAPAGIGYSYLDWFGAYQMGLAMMAALYRQRQTGRGCWIDSSQAEIGIQLTGTAVLDHSVNGRSWRRTGNRSPLLPAAPHGVYPAAGQDRWIALGAFDEEQWIGLCRVLGRTEWAAHPDLLTLAQRLRHQDRLDEVVAEATAKWDAFALMEQLQAEGVPAGVCQTAEDRCERDPQLRHLGWLVELDQTEIGRWPVKELPGVLSETPSHIGGLLDRSGPNYGEDNDYVYGEILGLSPEERAALVAEGVI